MYELCSSAIIRGIIALIFMFLADADYFNKARQASFIMMMVPIRSGEASTIMNAVSSSTMEAEWLNSSRCLLILEIFLISRMLLILVINST